MELSLPSAASTRNRGMFGRIHASFSKMAYLDNKVSLHVPGLLCCICCNMHPDVGHSHTRPSFFFFAVARILEKCTL